jgi:lysyl-tRNA synthetase class 2
VSKENQSPENGMANENRLIAERREKLDAMREAGQAYPNDFHPDITAAGLLSRFGDDDAEALQQVTERFHVGGRMMAKRVMGKIALVGHWRHHRRCRQHHADQQG